MDNDINIDNLTLGFLGFGLIGGSIAKSLKEKKPDIKIKVYSRRKNPELEKGMETGIIDKIIYSIDESFSDCDIIFLCAPVEKNLEFLDIIKPIAKNDCIITDVGSTKKSIYEKALKIGLENQFIGGHPMAGAEKTGYENSNADILKNAFYLLIPTDKTKEASLLLLNNLVKLCQAKPVIITPDKHDMVTAAISHLPHVVAVSLVNTIRQADKDNTGIKTFAAGGFKDITRIASSSPEMWQDICVDNGLAINKFIDDMISQLENFKKLIEEKDKQGINKEFSLAGSYRNSIKDKK